MMESAQYELECIQSLTDKEIIAAILNRNPEVTKAYLYNKCLPLFCSIYSKYYTDCRNVKEFIDEIYVYILTPNKNTGLCKLATCGFRCTLTMWLKIVATNYCHQLYAHRIESSEEIDERFKASDDNSCIDIDLSRIDRTDIRKLLELMPNKRYRTLLDYRYLQEKSNEETAALLEMNMPNYYNKHKLAKMQLYSVIKREGLI